jgi:hypothetical protein
MGLSISTRKENDKWVCHVVCSGAKPAYYYGDNQDEVYEMGLSYLQQNYFNLTNEEVNKRVELKKAQEK